MRISAIDSYILEFINHHMQNSFFDWIMPLASSGGVIIWIFFAIVLFFWWPLHGKKTALLTITALLLSSLLVSDFLKEIFGRPRPFLTSDVRLLIEKPTSFSFPSGHSANSFACATVIAKKIKPLAPLMFLTAFIIAFSRVYVGVHYPFDVVVGVIIGLICGLLVLYIESFHTKQ